MSQKSKANVTQGPAFVSGDSDQSFETSVRQLIANGNFKAALENAKDFHKLRRTGASESLLLDAYAARIQSLLDQNLATEAKSLLELVLQRFPAAKERLGSSAAAISARTGDLGELLRPLNDPELDPSRRAAIEQIVQTQLTDLSALAACPVLPPEHNLRQAAAALARAFDQVTTGPVTEDQIALPEVPFRSPLAAWKVLIRAIACLHRGEDQACREYLAAIKPESVPSRLIPAMHAILDLKPAAALKQTEAALISRIGADLAPLRSALINLDRSFEEDDSGSRTIKAMQAAVRECQRSAPDFLEELKQVVAVRGEVACLDKKRLLDALGGEPRKDAAFFRMYALALESSSDDEDLLEACEVWDRFRAQAVREGWFQSSGLEAATLFLHMADVLERAPDHLLTQFQRYPPFGSRQDAGDDRYFLYPEKLYARACSIDPHPEAFARWMRWASGKSISRTEEVAREWHKIRPRDMEPILYLMQRAENRRAFPTALSFLEKAERIDAVQPEVRAARLRLLASGTLNHLHKKKPHLAEDKLSLMAGLPQSQQGDRPAFLSAVRHLICSVSADDAGAAAARLETERRLGSNIAAGFLISGLAAIAKRFDPLFLPSPKALSKQEKKAVPASVARVMALAKDLGITEFQIPAPYLSETEKQFAGAKQSLDVEQLLSLGEMGVGTGRPKLAWAASGEGLERGGPSEARFLLLRARAIPPGYAQRSLVLAAAAVELGRFHSDMDVVDRAVDMVRNPVTGDALSLTLEQARDVVLRELKSPAYPGDTFTPAPDYSDLLTFHGKPCPCPDCRRQRGEKADLYQEDLYDEGPFDEGPDAFEFDEAALAKMVRESLPKGTPPAIAEQLLEIMKESLLTGEAPEEIMSRVMGGARKKGRRKR